MRKGELLDYSRHVCLPLVNVDYPYTAIAWIFGNDGHIISLFHFLIIFLRAWSHCDNKIHVTAAIKQKSEKHPSRDLKIELSTQWGGGHTPFLLGTNAKSAEKAVLSSIPMGPDTPSIGNHLTIRSHFPHRQRCWRHDLCPPGLCENHFCARPFKILAQGLSDNSTLWLVLSLRGNQSQFFLYYIRSHVLLISTTKRLITSLS